MILVAHVIVSTKHLSARATLPENYFFVALWAILVASMHIDITIMTVGSAHLKVPYSVANIVAAI